MFHPVVDEWLRKKFGAPTPVQERAWPTIAEGGDALIAAPTGSGKTLAAFLFCLDRLVRAATDGALEDHTHVVYVSPLKALSNDVRKNLDEPIAEIALLAEEMGYAMMPLRTAVRTGDTTARERRESVKRPPHVLVTTPESLFILLTSDSGRRGLERVETLILDEIHAMIGDKRGAHLALSVERLEDLVRRQGGKRPQRIGLSATMRPLAIAARFLVGGADMPSVVDTGHRRDIDFAVEVPKDELGAVSTNEQWAELYDRLATLALEHRSTLVFVNTRRLTERLAYHLGQRLGEGVVAAHHGSLSRARRLVAEQRLKAGELRVVVATASLELGIDVGTIDLCCVIGSPRSIATALQRIGRSGHALRATPKGRLFPLTRDQLVECAAIVRAARRGALDALWARRAPLDILAQQIVAMAAAEEQGEDELFALAQRSAPYMELAREDFDKIVTMLSEGVATRRGRAGALVHRDAVNKRLRGRRGARIAALTSGGAIPDNANYDVLLLPEATKIGTVDEDFAIDSMAGDVFLLGNASWRIHRVETGKVWVEDAHGAPPSVPFWFGEAPARTRELSDEVGALREEISARIAAEGEAKTIAWLMESCALDEPGARLCCAYVEAGRAALGAVPSTRTVVAERFFDEAGGMQLVIHAPFGGRITRAWGTALRKRFCRNFDFELQAAATDDGVLLSLGPQHSFPLESILDLLRPEGLQEALTQAAFQAPMFGTRFRWNASRSLALLRFNGGRRVPPAIQRMRSDDLLAAIFPAQQGCQDNHGIGAHIEPPDHPIVNETIRDCLEEVMDAEGLGRVLEDLRSGALRFVASETTEPSVFSHEILNANPYAFLDDAPLEERRARAVAVRRGLPPQIVERVGGLDHEVIAEVVREVQPSPVSADELHDLLLDLVLLPETEARRAGWVELFAELERDRRAARRIRDDGLVAWVPAERRSLAEALWPTGRFSQEILAPAGSKGVNPVDPGDAMVEALRGRLAIVGPVTASALAHDLGVDRDDVFIALARIESEGWVLRGHFRGTSEDEIEWCNRTLLARIHRRIAAGLRRAIEPVSPADLMRFLFAWQGVTGPKGRGRGRLLRVIEALEGFELAAGAWESEVLPARVAGYDPALLDELCLSGEVTWGRLSPRERGTQPTRAALITFARRSDLAWLLESNDASEPGEEGLSETARELSTLLRESGASFLEELVEASGRHRAEVEDALWELCAAGRVTGDGFGGMRALIERSPREAVPWRVGRFQGGKARAAAGRWSLLRSSKRRAAGALDEEERIEHFARLYLRRYGVVFRDMLAREAKAPLWRDLLRAYRLLEMRGEIRGGRFVYGFVGEQFALPEAATSLREIARGEKHGERVELSACDPLNLVGILTPGPRVAAHLGNRVIFRDGVPVDEASEPAAEVA